MPRLPLGTAVSAAERVLLGLFAGLAYCASVLFGPRDSV